MAQSTEAKPDRASAQYLRWRDLTRAKAEQLVMYGDGMDGTWLLRELTSSSYSICVVYKSVPTHHLVEIHHDGTCMLNHKDVGKLSINGVISSLKEDPVSLGWPLSLRADRVIRPWAVGDVVSAPYSVNNVYFDCVVIDLFPAGNFKNIPVDLARVSYVGYATDNDDCVPISVLRVPTGVQNPDFYTPGSLKSGWETGRFSPEESKEVRDIRLRALHEDALSRSITLLVAKEHVENDIAIANGGAGNFIVGVRPEVAATMNMHAGMRIQEVNGTDVEAASEADCKRLMLNSSEEMCVLVLKIDPEGFKHVVDAVGPDVSKIPLGLKEIVQAPPPPPPEVDVPTPFPEPAAMQQRTGAADSDDAICKLTAQSDQSIGVAFRDTVYGVFVSKVVHGGLAHGKVDVGMRVATVNDQDVLTMSKKEVLSVLSAAKQSAPQFTLGFKADPAAAMALQDQLHDKGGAGASGAAPPTAPPPASATSVDTPVVVATTLTPQKDTTSDVSSKKNSTNKKGGSKKEASKTDSVKAAAKKDSKTKKNSARSIGSKKDAATTKKDSKKRHSTKAGAAESQQHVVQFTEQGRLGIKFVCAAVGQGVFVEGVSASGLGAGKVHRGARILRVGAADVSQLDKEGVVDVIKQQRTPSGEITLVFGEDRQGFARATQGTGTETGTVAPTFVPPAPVVEAAPAQKMLTRGAGMVDFRASTPGQLGVTFTNIGTGNFVIRVKDDGLIAQSGVGVKRGMKLVGIDGIDVGGFSKDERSTLIKHNRDANGTIELTFVNDTQGWKHLQEQKKAKKGAQK